MEQTCIYCAGVVHPKRVEILQNKKQPISCITCAEEKVQKVVGFQVNHDKACREIDIVSADQAKRLQSLTRKGGQATGGPGVGPKAGKIVYKG